MDDCIKLKAAGYTEHDIAQLAKVPTPWVVKLARYGTPPPTPIDGIDVEALLKEKKPKEEAKAVVEEAKKEVFEAPKTPESPKNEVKK